MRLLWIQIEDDDCSEMMDELKRCGYRATLISSTEDFLNFGETTLILGVEDEQCEEVIKKLKDFYKKDPKFMHGQKKENISIYVMDTVKSVFIKPAALSNS